MEVRVGALAAGETVKETLPLVPPAVVTETFCCPAGAFAAMVNVAVACVPLPTETFDTVMPDPVLTVRGETKAVPVRVTATVEP